jgi:hypothetical protein
MNIYLIERQGAFCDEVSGFVIVAPNKGAARVLASMEPGDEGPDVWLVPDKAACALLGTGFGQPRIVLRDFHAG